MDTKTGYFESTPGNKSFGRLNIAWYFWTICVPSSLAIVAALCQIVLKGGNIDIAVLGTLIILFLFLQVGWIAPKILAKVAEENGDVTNKLIDKNIKQIDKQTNI